MRKCWVSIVFQSSFGSFARVRGRATSTSARDDERDEESEAAQAATV